MTLPHEELHALMATRNFLYDLLDPKKTPRVPRSIRLRARIVCKHYPFPAEIRERWEQSIRESGWGSELNRYSDAVDGGSKRE